MGLKFELKKELNHLYVDFPDAYWAVDNISVYPEGDKTYVHFEISAYANRESRLMEGQRVQEPTAKDVPFGGAVRPVYEPVLFHATQEIPASWLFSAVPTTISEQKDVIYSYVKTMLDNAETQYEDVLEEGQTASEGVVTYGLPD